MVLGECDELGWCGSACAGEDLRVNVGGEMLHADGTEAGFRGDCMTLLHCTMPAD
jgi:hypothetical protein